MTESGVRVLVVDDMEQWRRVVRTALQAKLGLQIFEEAADGLEALQKAQDLQPDLVVLDIGLPKLHGIEVGRRIRSASPKSKVVFLTENRSWEVAEAALQDGARGYVVKSDGINELVNGVRSVLDGRCYISASLRGIPLSDDRAEPVREADGKTALRHKVNLFRDDSALVDGFAGFIGALLRSGSPVVVLATEAHRASIVRKLSQEGVDVGAAIAEKLFTPMDAADSLPNFRLAEHLAEQAAKLAPDTLRVGVG